MTGTAPAGRTGAVLIEAKESTSSLETPVEICGLASGGIHVRASGERGYRQRLLVGRYDAASETLRRLEPTNPKA